MSTFHLAFSVVRKVSGGLGNCKERSKTPHYIIFRKVPVYYNIRVIMSVLFNL